MKRHAFLTITFIVLSVGLNAQNTANSTIFSFQQVQNSMKKHYDHIKENGIFEDPLGRIDVYFNTIQKIAPELLCDTYQYKDDLLSILTDSISFDKNNYTDIDVRYLLFNMLIDDYVDLLYDVYSLYKQNIISEEVFDDFLFQEPNVSNSVVRNYENKKLNQFFDTLINEKCLSDAIKKRVIRIKSGESWHGKFGRKRLSEIQPPILDRLNKECQ